MRRKVIGYEKTIEYLKNGYEIISAPLYKNDWIYDKENDEFITIRYDVLGKLFMNKFELKRRKENWYTIYSIGE